MGNTLGNKLHFSSRETAEIKNRIRAARASIKIDTNKSCQQDRTSYDPDSACSTCDHADAELRLWNLYTIKGTRKNDPINSTENASPHRPNKEKVQKIKSSNEEKGGDKRKMVEEEKANHRNSDEEAAEGSS